MAEFVHSAVLKGRLGLAVVPRGCIRERWQARLLATGAATKMPYRFSPEERECAMGVC